MQRANLQVGQTYYVEDRNGNWNEYRRRDIRNRYGRNKARVESLDRYRETTDLERRRLNLDRFVLAEKGDYVRVTIFAGNDTISSYYQHDRIEFIRPREIRGVWSEVVNHTDNMLDLWAREERAEQVRKDAINTRRRALIDRAAEVGLVVRASPFAPRELMISEDALTAFLDGLEHTLSTVAKD